MAQVVEHFPCKYEALNSNPTTAKKKDIYELGEFTSKII
jgi:hypothetical protein